MINFLEEAEKIIGINSVSQDGNEEIAVYLQSLLNKTGFKTSLQEVTHSAEGVSKRQFNLIGILGDPLVDSKTKKGLLLNTHLDTVGPGIKSYWTETGGDPFKATIKGESIYGLGSADVKLDFLCKLKACERYADRKLKMPVYLVGSAAEEIGMLGAKFLIKSKALNPKYAVVGEPSELAVIPAHKAYSVYKLSICYTQLERDAKGFNTRMEMRCLGKSTHGSYPDKGDNAVYKMLAAIQKIKDANFTIKISRIKGGESVNKVPDSAAVEFYIASSSFEDFKRFYRDKLTAESMQNQIQIQFGGLGETGIRFIPDAALEGLGAVRSLFEGLKTDLLSAKDDTFNPNESTFNLGKLSHEEGSIDLHYDVRLLPSVSPDEFDSKLKDSIAKLNARYPNLILKVNRLRTNPGLNMSTDSELVTAALEAQKVARITTGLAKKATSTEAAQYFSAGYDAIVFGPGKSMGNSHTPNEYNTIDQLDKAVHFYDRMIERFCL